MSIHVRGASTSSRPDPNAAVRRELARDHRPPRPLAWLLAVALVVGGGNGLAGWLTGPGGRLTASSSGQTVLQGTDPHLHWSAGWTVVDSASASGGSLHVSGVAGASVSLVYYGSYLQILARTGHDTGIMQVTLDGTTTSVSTQASPFHPHEVVFTRALTGGRHVLTIRVAGTAGHPFVAIDAIVISPVRTPGAGTGRSYGSGIGADALANTQIGGTSCGCSNSSTSYRFRATTSSSLASVRVYLVDGSGYAGGTGGTLSISVQTDDGSANHAPSGTVLASTTIRPGNPVSIGYLPLITFSSPATLTGGQLYHLVFRNTDPSPTVNYVSVNALWTSNITTPRQLSLNDPDWAQLMNPGSGWTVRPNYTPILNLGYANGVHAGMGYMEVWVNAPKTISGANAVREIFTPSSDHSVSSVSVRVRQVSGASPLTVQLETAGGTVLATGQISAASIGSSPSWVSTNLSSAVTLQAGQGYQLVLSAPSDSSYSAFAIERGNNYQFAASTYFSDGYGQYTTGSGWSGFDQPGGSSNNTNSDLQVYFQ